MFILRKPRICPHEAEAPAWYVSDAVFCNPPGSNPDLAKVRVPRPRAAGGPGRVRAFVPPRASCSAVRGRTFLQGSYIFENEKKSAGVSVSVFEIFTTASIGQCTPRCHRRLDDRKYTFELSVGF